MYLTGGQYKGFKIEVPKNTRPTLSKVRESIFNMLLQYYPDGGKFLDMFAGSGIMGLEAISRGYKVVELEKNHKTAATIKNNYKKIKTIPKIVICDSLKFITDEYFDIVYIDPPWEYDYNSIIKKSAEFIDKDGIIILEYDSTKKTDFNPVISELNLNVLKQKKYGRTMITFLSKQ